MKRSESAGYVTLYDKATEKQVEHIRQDPEIREIFNDCMWSTAKYGKVFYAGRFTLPFSDLHHQMLDVIDARIEYKGEIIPKYQKIVIKASRGIGKTSLVKTYIAKSLRYLDFMHGVYIGKSHDFATQQTESIKRSMLQNSLENKVFGSMKTTVNKRMADTFSKNSWMTAHGQFMWPRGCQQPVRGLLHDYDGGSYRLQRIILDDLEDPDMIASELYRKRTKEWVLADVVEAVPLPGVSRNWQIIYIDTLKHEDSCLQMLLDSRDWKSIEISISDDKYRSLAPVFISDEEIMNKVIHHRERGTLDVFYREIMGIAVSLEDAKFQTSMFKYYDETDEEFITSCREGWVENVILVDPAKTTTGSSAQSAVVGVGVDKRSSVQKIYLRDVVARKMHPDEMYNEVFAMADRLRPCHVIGLEVTSLEEFIEYPFRNEMLARGLNYEIVKLKPRRAPAESMDKTKGKEGRIAGLIPLYRRGSVFHNSTICGGLEAQLLSYPRSKRWDIMDGFAYIVQLLEMGLRYFESGDDVEDSFQQIENEYRDLSDEYDEPLTNWRISP